MQPREIFSRFKVFVSYSHKDEALKVELGKHLEALRRSGVIDIWHDRKIGPGEAWRSCIDENLRAAEIVLLLTSPDFISSRYCYDVETDFALKRRDAGEAVVIPVLLRPVDLEGLPLAELQQLPEGCKPVTMWGDQDDALKNVAAGIRSVVDELVRRRVRAQAHKPLPGRLLEARFLDAAIASEIPVGKFREVFAFVRPAESEGLRLLLGEDISSDQRRYSCDPAQVRSEPFSASFRPMADGDLQSCGYKVAIVAPDLEVADAPKSFTLQPRRESIVFKFFVKANSEGEHRIRVDLYEGSERAAEGLLSTSATSHGPDGGPGRAASHLLASVELITRVFARAASAGGGASRS